MERRNFLKQLRKIQSALEALDSYTNQDKQLKPLENETSLELMAASEKVFEKILTIFEKPKFSKGDIVIWKDVRCDFGGSFFHIISSVEWDVDNCWWSYTYDGDWAEKHSAGDDEDYEIATRQELESHLNTEGGGVPKKKVEFLLKQIDIVPKRRVVEPYK